jgi:pyridoxamine 5'-phosphate oxidase
VEADELDPDPLVQLARWVADARAAGIVNAEAMSLATVSVAGHASVRMVLLKGCDSYGLTFFTNLESRKAVELAATPRAAVALYWQPLDRQARAEGPIQRVSDVESHEYFATRPRESRLAAWASPQSQVVADRAELERLYAAQEARFAGVDDPPLPPHWGGYRLVPETVELWESRPSRLHDRILYERDGDGWRRSRLAP